MASAPCSPQAPVPTAADIPTGIGWNIAKNIDFSFSEINSIACRVEGAFKLLVVTIKN